MSVVVTTYNRPTYLRSAIESVRAQTYDPIELVVVDDHSTHPASDVVESIDKTPLASVTCVRHDENKGANAARNTGIQHASGKYVAFLDDDDQWDRTKLQRQVEAFDDEYEIGVVYTGMKIAHEDQEDLIIPEAIEGDITKALLCRNVVGTMSSVMVRTDLARAVPLDEEFPSWADLEWYIRLSTEARFVRLPEPLVIYEFDSHNRLSDDFGKTRRSYELFVQKFDGLARQYGRLFRRKMYGWAAFRAGTSALYSGYYEQARHYMSTAALWYPFELTFHKYLLATLGGRYTHNLVRATKRLLP